MEPLKVALLGCGRRANRIYFPILSALKDSLQVTAVVDRVSDLARSAGDYFGVPAYDSIQQLVRDRPMEAAIVVTPVHSHHAISCYLSRHGIHHLIETPVADTLAQARQMMALADEHGVRCRIGEQFFRDPIDLLSRRVIASGAIGHVGRITHFQGHLGYHNNSRHQAMAGGRAPVAVHQLSHTMAMQPYMNTDRFFTNETFRNVSYIFDDGLLITDLAGNIKGAMGRYSRPGYMEIDGSNGSIIAQATEPWNGIAEVRLIPAAQLKLAGNHISYPVYYRWKTPDGQMIETRTSNKWDWNGVNAYAGIRVELPDQELAVDNPFLASGIRMAYLTEVAGHMHDFARLVRTGEPDQFTPEMAVNSLAMELAGELSARRHGVRVVLDDPALGALDEERLQAARAELGINPNDIDAMIEYSFPKQ